MKNKIPERIVRVTTCTCWQCGCEDSGQPEMGAPNGWLSAGVSQKVAETKTIHSVGGWETKVSSNSRFCCLKCMLDYLSTEVN